MTDEQRIRELIDSIEPRFQDEARSMIERARGLIDDELVLRLLEEGRYDELVEAVSPPPALSASIQQLLQTVITQTGQGMIDSLNVGLVFDPGNREVAEWMQSRAASRVSSSTDEQRAAIREIVSEGVSLGENPRQTALTVAGRFDQKSQRRVGGVAGLDAPQARTVARVRRGLLSGDPEIMRSYLSLKTRDARFDSSVERALSEGGNLTEDGVDRIIGRLTDRSIRVRAERIARSETISSMSAGRHFAFLQRVEASNYGVEDVEKEWRDSRDLRVRDSHGGMHGQKVVGMGTPFVSPLTGDMMLFPADPSLGARAGERIQCRCFCMYRILV